VKLFHIYIYIYCISIKIIYKKIRKKKQKEARHLSQKDETPIERRLVKHGLLCALTFFFIFLLKGKRYVVYPYLKKKKQATHHLLTYIPMIGEVVKKSSYVIWTIF